MVHFLQLTPIAMKIAFPFPSFTFIFRYLFNVVDRLCGGLHDTCLLVFLSYHTAPSLWMCMSLATNQ